MIEQTIGRAICVTSSRVETIKSEMRLLSQLFVCVREIWHVETNDLIQLCASAPSLALVAQQM